MHFFLLLYYFLTFSFIFISFLLSLITFFGFFFLFSSAALKHLPTLFGDIQLFYSKERKEDKRPEEFPDFVETQEIKDYIGKLDL